MPARLADGDAPAAAVTLENVGPRAGGETVQVYLAPPAPPVQQAPRVLAGFERVHLEPGERRRVRVALDPRAFAYWDEAARGWRPAPGRYRVEAAASSRDIRLTADVTFAARASPESERGDPGSK